MQEFSCKEHSLSKEIAHRLQHDANGYLMQRLVQGKDESPHSSDLAKSEQVSQLLMEVKDQRDADLENSTARESSHQGSEVLIVLCCGSISM